LVARPRLLWDDLAADFFAVLFLLADFFCAAFFIGLAALFFCPLRPPALF
jgi:hypothetical protein